MADQVGEGPDNISATHNEMGQRCKRRNRKKKKTPKRAVVQINSKKDRKLIAEYHTLNKRIDALQKNSLIPKEDKDSRIAALKAKREKIGGINAYQQASKLGEAHHGSFNSAKWVVKQLKAFNVRPAAEKQLKMLDVGALDNNYQKQSKWIQCTPIDLNPQNSQVIRADLLTLKDTKEYDVIVLSLVVNFEADIRKRGEMLRKCQELIVHEGYLFIVLPLACLENSRYLNEDQFVSMLGSLGFEVCFGHNSRKLCFYMFRKTNQPSAKSFPKRVLRKGGNHNNFAIVL
ncbi:uncharacterized protein [Montipora foliosa]|uniref:uncharacterized protein n=1 Tax=Montipora foliosa TaxID=591990 RepID=UPI0035F1AE27